MVVPTLVAQLDLPGTVVVGDAMQTQREVRVQVVAAGGDYVWFVKEHQPTLLAEISELFTPPPITPGHAAPAGISRPPARWRKGTGGWTNGC